VPSIFLSHNHQDKPFVRRLAADLSAMGVRVWLDEAELRIGDSLIQKIQTAIDEMDYLGVILSPSAAASHWVKEELSQALYRQLSANNVIVLPMLLRDCEIPGFLRDKLYADFRNETNYEHALGQLLLTFGINPKQPYGASILDPFARTYDRVSSFYARPSKWYCIYCGWKCTRPSSNSYMCLQCNAIRPLIADTATITKCDNCGQWNLALAQYCEWCGSPYR
jgi:hypothetical protein